MEKNNKAGYIVIGVALVVVLVLFMIPSPTVTGNVVRPFCETMDSCVRGYDNDKDGYSGCEDLDCQNLIGDECGPVAQVPGQRQSITVCLDERLYIEPVEPDEGIEPDNEDGFSGEKARPTFSDSDDDNPQENNCGIVAQVSGQRPRVVCNDGVNSVINTDPTIGPEIKRIDTSVRSKKDARASRRVSTSFKSSSQKKGRFQWFFSKFLN